MSSESGESTFGPLDASCPGGLPGCLCCERAERYRTERDHYARQVESENFGLNAMHETFVHMWNYKDEAKRLRAQIDDALEALADEIRGNVAYEDGVRPAVAVLRAHGEMTDELEGLA